MSPLTVGIIGIVVLFVLFLARMPVAYVMGLVGFLGFAYVVSTEAAGTKLALNFYSTFGDYGFTVIPLFVWMGFVAFHSGISEKLFNAAYKVIGSARGGLAMATVMACAGFGAICGSSTATTATMGVVAWPEMRKCHYQEALGTACIAAAGILGNMIPPSVVLIVYGFIATQSISELFIATIFPGLLLTGLYMLAIYIITLFRPELAPAGPRTGLKEKLLGLSGGTGETLAIFLLVLGGLFAGLFTPTEAAGAGAASVLLVALARRRLSWQAFTKSLLDATRTSAMILIIIVGAIMFGHFITVTGLSSGLADWIAGLAVPPVVIWGFFVIMWLLLGCFIEAMALMLLTVPIFLPVFMNLGYDLVWLGPMLMLAGGLGVLTPPVGMDVYVASGVTGVPIGTVFRGIIPFLLAIIVTIAICTAFPGIVMFLPGLMS